MPDTPAPPSDAAAGHERPSVAASTVLKIAAALIGFLALCLVVIAVAFRWSIGTFPLPTGPAAPVAVFPEPRLQIRPPVDLARLRADEDRKLGGDAAMPIERAMAAIAARGPDAYAPLVPPRDASPGAPP